MKTITIAVAGILWCGTAYGEPAGVSVENGSALVAEPYILESVAGRERLAVEISADVVRNEGLVRERVIPVRYSVQLMEVGETRPVGSGELVVDYVVPGVANFPVSEVVLLEPDDVLTDGGDFFVEVVISHDDDPRSGVFEEDDAFSTAAGKVAHFTGALSFGPSLTTLTGLGAVPVWNAGLGQWVLSGATGEMATGFSYSQGAGQLRAVRDKGGDLEVTFGSVDVAAGDPGFSWMGWTGARGAVRLNIAGAVASGMTLELPAGCGIREGTSGLLGDLFDAGSAAILLDDTLMPSRISNGVFGAAVEMVTETYPVAFGGTGWRFEGAALRLLSPSVRFFREEAYSTWAGSTMGSGDLPTTNDGYYYDASGVSGDLVVRPGGFDFELEVGSGEFFPHFPIAGVAYDEGTVAVEANVIDPAVSVFEVTRAQVLYGKGCRAEGELNALPTPVMGLELTAGTATITGSGGISMGGVLAPEVAGVSERHLVIGQNGSGEDTHWTDEFSEGQFYMPGTWAPVGLAENVAGYLLAGLAGDGSLEVPGTEAYELGGGDYAGMNFRHFGGLMGHSRIGDDVVPPYTLAETSKWYARASGVAGKTVGDPGPAQVMAYGYDLALDKFAFSTLANEMVESEIDGVFDFPEPVGFTQAIEGLRISCCGKLEGAEIAPWDREKNLVYWGFAEVDNRSLSFTGSDNCAAGDQTVVIGTVGEVGLLPGEHAGFLYISPGGDLEVRTELVLAQNGLELAGYPWFPVRNAFYNREGASGGEGPGVVVLAGMLGLPFFEDARLVAHTGGRDEPWAFANLTGGWDVGGATYFNDAGFDAGNRGFPGGVGLEAFQTGTRTNVQASWFGPIRFDYDVQWDPASSSFRSLETNGIDLSILETEGKVERLTAEMAALRFRLEVDVAGALTMTNLLESALETGVAGFADMASEAILDATPLGDGLARLDEILNVDIRELLGEPVDLAWDATIGALAEEVRTAPAPGDVDLDAVFGDGGALSGVLGGLALPDGSGVLNLELGEALADVEAGVLRGGEMFAVRERVQAYVMRGLELTGIDPAVLPAGLVEDELDELFGDGIDGTGGVAELLGALKEALEFLGEVRGAVAELRDSLGGGEFGEELAALLGDATELGNLRDEMRAAVEDYLEDEVYAGLGADAFSEDELREALKGVIADRLFGSGMIGNVQTMLRGRVYLVDAAFKTALNSVLRRVSDAILDVASEQLAAISEKAEKLAVAVPIKNFRIDGAAVITGDRLTKLRLDGHTVIDILGFPVAFDAWYEFCELVSDGTTACEGPDGTMRNEITLGATGSPAFGVFDSGAHVTVAAKFAFDDAGPLGFMGSFETSAGSTAGESIGVTDFSAQFAAGVIPADDDFYCYVAAAADGNFGGIEMTGGVGMGRFCDLGPLSFYPDAEEIFDAPFTGTLGYVSGVMPLYSVGCVVEVKVGAGVGAFVLFDDGEPGFGGLVEGQASGKLLCVLSAKGEVELQGAKLPGREARFSGRAEMEAKVGIGPFKKSITKKLDASYSKSAGWDVEL